MTPPEIRTEYVFSLKGGSIVGGGKPKMIEIGDAPTGRRRIVPIIGAIIEGPAINGKVIDGGADRQVDRADGVLEMNAVWDLETDDGVIISVENLMIRHASAEVMARMLREEVDPSAYYFRGWPKLEAPAGRYDWVNRSVFLSSGVRTPTSVIIHFFKVL